MASEYVSKRELATLPGGSLLKLRSARRIGVWHGQVVKAVQILEDGSAAFVVLPGTVNPRMRYVFTDFIRVMRCTECGDPTHTPGECPQIIQGG
jgi:hypothetical protein